MSILYKARGYFTVGKMKMVQNPNVHLVDINITTNGLEFIGLFDPFTKGFIPGFKPFTLNKNSTGYRLDISWSDIKFINKVKRMMMRVIIVETHDLFYSILPVDPEHTKSMGITKSSQNANELLASINDAQAQIQAGTPKSSFCTNCGEKRKPDSDFCGSCGFKFQ
ncbi:MAG: zinc ribbon domain-containing protein [Promethearchaeota archaeon]